MGLLRSPTDILPTYNKAVASDRSADAQLHLAYGAIPCSRNSRTPRHRLSRRPRRRRALPDD